MKKAIVLLLALAVLGGAAFAEDVAYTLTGSASLIWGFDLNTEHHGFTNKADATLTVPFIKKQSSTHGEEAITGTITIKNFEYKMVDKISGAPVQTMTAGSITAKILFPNDLYLQIASAPDFTISNAVMQGPISAADWDGSATYNPFDVTATIPSSGGFTFGMDGDFSFALMVGSTNTHTAAATAATTDVYGWIDDDDDPTTEPVWGIVTPAAPAGAAPTDDYMVGGSFSYAIEDLADFGVNFIFGAFQNAHPTTGVGVYANATPVEGLSLYLGADFNLGYYVAAPTDKTFNGMDLQFDANYEMADMFKAGAGVYMSIPNLDATTGNPLLTAVVSAGLLAVENMTLDVAFNMFDILNAADPATNDMIMAFSVNADYTMKLDDENYVKPYASFAMVPKATRVGFWVPAELSTLNLGVEAKFFPLTTFTLDFTAGEITADSIFTGTTMGDVAGKDKGVITFTTKIT